MVIDHKIHYFNLLREGMRVSEFLRNSSFNCLEELKQLNLITIDPYHRVHLTEKGQVAKKIGMKKFIELEAFEKEWINENSHMLPERNKVLLLIICSLNFLLIIVLVHVCLKASGI